MKFVRTWTREELGTFVREPLVARNFERGPSSSRARAAPNATAWPAKAAARGPT
jgi:hypothetical protein